MSAIDARPGDPSWWSTIVISVAATLIGAMVLAGVTVWRDMAVLQTQVNDLNTNVTKLIEDHETRIRALEHNDVRHP